MNPRNIPHELMSTFDVVSMLIYEKSYTELSVLESLNITVTIVKTISKLAVKQGKKTEVNEFISETYSDLELTNMSNKAKAVVADILDDVRDGVRDVSK